ncbi:DUF6011 domain-containing protein [Geodermatophilus sp. URMC 62]|uniref:DUF6011 domain-containing protein n=1 Tax=Geodermatophilus sp. URMC 62 TaxID=3423414 RepID=UPI00406D038C
MLIDSTSDPTPPPVLRIVRDNRGVPHVDDPVTGRREATEDEVAEAARAAVAAGKGKSLMPQPPAPPVRWDTYGRSYRDRYGRRRYGSTRRYPVAVPWDTPPPYTRLPAGYYAVELDGWLRFFRVKPSRHILAQRAGELHALATAEQARVASVIAQDIPGALAAYGREIGRCGRCGSELTNAESRARGLGPDCAALLDGEVTE